MSDLEHAADTPPSHAAPDAHATGAPGPDVRRAGADPLMQVRATDVEPYTGLGYLSKLFRIIAVLLLVLLVAEVGTGLYTEGSEALRTLLSEASRLIVVAGVLWGVGDVANLLIDLGHDVRAGRILLGRIAAHGGPPHNLGEGPERVHGRVIDRVHERAIADQRATHASSERTAEWQMERPADRAADRAADLAPRRVADRDSERSPAPRAVYDPSPEADAR